MDENVEVDYHDDESAQPRDESKPQEEEVNKDDNEPMNEETEKKEKRSSSGSKSRSSWERNRSRSSSHGRNRRSSPSPTKHANLPRSRSREDRRDKDRNFGRRDHHYHHNHYGGGGGGGYRSNYGSSRHHDNYEHNDYYGRDHRSRYNRSRSGSPRRSSHRRSSPDHGKDDYRRYCYRHPEVTWPGLNGMLVPFNMFMNNQRNPISPERAERYFSKYKEAHTRKQYEIFFTEHKNEHWFKEKYHPAEKSKIRLMRDEQSRELASGFFDRLGNGGFEGLSLEYDPTYHMDPSSSVQEGEPNPVVNDMDTDGKPEKGEVEEGETTAQNQPEEREGGEIVEEADEGEIEEPRHGHEDPFSGERKPFTGNIAASPYYGFDANSQTLFLKAAPMGVSRWDLLKVLKETPGFVSLSMSEPIKGQALARYAWALFDSEESCQAGNEKLNRQVITKEFTLSPVKSKPNQKKLYRTAPQISHVRTKVDLEQTRALIEKLDTEKGIEKNPLPNMSTDDHPETCLLDLNLIYLRKVHYYCYYSGEEYEDERMLAAKCSPAYIRPLKKPTELDKLTAETPDGWAEKVEEGYKARLGRDAPQLFDEYIEKKKEEFGTLKTDQRSNDRFACMLCEKLFCGGEYVKKHLINRHPKEVEDHVEREANNQMLENYIADPHKLSNPLVPYNSTPYGSTGMPYMAYQPVYFRGGPGPRYRPRGFPRGGGRRYGDRSGGHRDYPRRDYVDLDDPGASHGGQGDSRTIVDYNDI